MRVLLADEVFIAFVLERWTTQKGGEKVNKREKLEKIGEVADVELWDVSKALPQRLLSNPKPDTRNQKPET